MKMKKCAIAFLLSMSIFQAAHSQDSTEQSLNPKFGLKGSFIGAYNTAHFNGAANTTMNTRAGWGVGAFLDIPFSTSWGAQIGLNYAAMGTKLTGYYLNLTYSSSQDIRYNYMTIPLLARYTIGTSGLTVMAGPQFGILLSARRVDGANNKTNVKSNLKSNDLAGVGGLEYKLPLHNFSHEVRIGASYQAGLSNIIKDISTNSNNKMYNNAFTGYVAFAF
ncbi:MULTISPECIES: porin family protein [Chitinophagaceae]